MQLAHDLQMKLLPDAAHVAPEALVAARVVPAEDVGGDFYNLYRLSNGRIGVMIGDVSGHGYQAALIMALTMSASAIHAQGTDDPAEMLRRLYLSVKEELTTTEMFVSALYAVVDREKQELRYGNTGHPHAFVVSREPGVSPEELDAHCRASPDLAGFKRPRRFVFVREIPKTASGKILRRLLRDGRYTEVHP